MNTDEQQLINQFFERVSGHSPAQSNANGTINHLPPIDPEADRLIADNFRKYPEAAYRMTQMAVVQEAALVEAQNRIRQLEWQVQQMQQQMQQQNQNQNQQVQQQRPASGFLGGLFGGGNRQQTQQQSPPPGWGGTPNRPQSYNQGPQNSSYGQQPQMNYPPGYQRGMFNQGGSGFLGSALSTAAGVAGGMMAYNALSGLFSGHGAASTPTTMPVDPSVSGQPDPFTGAGAAVDPNFDAGGDSNGFSSGAGSDSGFDGGGSDSGWDAGGSDQDSGGGFDDGGSWGDDSF